MVPVDDDGALATGTRLLIRGDLPGAIEALTRAARVDPRGGVAQHNLALALRASGDLPGAVRHAEEAAAAMPRAPTLALLGSLRMLEGDRDAAVTLFRKALAVDPSHAPSAYSLGVTIADPDALRQAIPGLPGLLAERARGQLRELEAGGRLGGALCDVPLVSEVLGVARPTPGAPSPAAAERRGRTIASAELTGLLASARRPVALTGAGLSVASGLRTRKQLWQTFDRDAAVSVWRFREDPRALWHVVRDFLGPDGEHGPNAAHHALARLPLAGIVTQNVDGLHQAAGSRCPVLELHGTLEATRCDACGARGPACRELLATLPPPCGCGGVLRPDVVLFGEWVAPARLAQAVELVATCDLLLVVGTAADVSPAADLPRLAAARGAVVVEVKHRPSRLHHAIGTLHVAGAAEDVLPAVVPEGARG